MLRFVAPLLGLLVLLPLLSPAHAAPTHGKRAPRQIWHGYGFLPGYRTPDRIDWENARARAHGYPQWWYGPPRWYHGQWNHGGFGPCYTETPIGEIWNCGK
jgi:hypothetical protein